MSMKYVMDLHAKIMQMRTKDIELARNGLYHLIIRAYDLT